MGFYEHWLFPRILDLSMRNKEATRLRALVVPDARGATLEVGIGSGLNLRFYGDRVERLIAVDPSEELLRMARRKARTTAFPIEFIARPGEELPLENNSVDSVVVTFTLCTVADPLKALREMRRVLKPRGEILFAEHGLAPDPGVARWQRRLNPLWRRVAGGCNLDRKMDDLIAGAGFRINKLTTEYVKGPRPMSYVYVGRASLA